MTKKKPEDLRITNQHRTRTGFVYDLKCKDDRIIVSILTGEGASDQGAFRVEARVSGPDATPVVGFGATKREALDAVGTAWPGHASQHGLPSFDWESIASVLVEVRAL